MRPNSNLTADGTLETVAEWGPTAEVLEAPLDAPDETGPVEVMFAMPAVDDEHPAQAVCEQLPDDGG